MIDIIYDSKCEMMRICKDGKCIFEGNFWDFDRNPKGIQEFINNLGLQNKIEELNYDKWYI